MKGRAGRDGEAGDVAGVGGDLRRDQNDGQVMRRERGHGAGLTPMPVLMLPDRSAWM